MHFLLSLRLSAFTFCSIQNGLDSLETILKNPNLVGLPRATMLNDLVSRTSEQKDMAKVIYLAKELLILSEKLNFQDEIIVSSK